MLGPTAYIVWRLASGSGFGSVFAVLFFMQFAVWSLFVGMYMAGMAFSINEPEPEPNAR
jgi:hypothetical protein